MAYSMDYRRAVANAYDECGSSTEVAQTFGCSGSWVRRLIQHHRDRGTLEPMSTAHHADLRRYDQADEETIRQLIGNRPDATLAEVAQALGKPAGASTVGRTLRRLGLGRKKVHARQRAAPAGRSRRPLGLACPLRRGATGSTPLRR
jgi:transposase